MVGRTTRRAGEPTRTRLISLKVLERVQRAGAYADLLLHATLARSSLRPADRAFATDLVYGTLRWRGRIDFLLSRLLTRDLEKLEPLVATALRMGAYQILFSQQTPDEAAVDESVRCIRAAGVERATGLVNAVLRRLAAEKDNLALPDLDEAPLDHLTHALSLPPWIATRWLEIFGAREAADLARASNEPPPLTIRVNRTRAERGELLEELRMRFPQARLTLLASDGIVLGRSGNPAIDPAFIDGRFSVQDEASQLVVALLDPQPDDQIVDTCAAPGGKSTAIAERLSDEGLVTALDRHRRRLDLVRRSARRLGVERIECREYDATRPLSDLFPDGGLDRILVDAPCSGLGSLRRNPDARWRVDPSDPARLADTQLAILRAAAGALRLDGVLVYSTCTLLPEENEDVLKAFLSDTSGPGRHFALAPRSDLPDEVQQVVDNQGMLRTLPHRDDTDGFFAARLVRKS